jgi:hypothetical protein
MKIDSYSFGKIIIDGKAYRSDVIIFPDRIKANWYRIKGHEVSPSDINEIIEAKPNLLIIGTGAYGLVKVSQETKELLRKNSIELIAKPTKKACEEYNRRKSEKVIAGLHLTC